MRYQHALKNLRQLLPKRRAQLAPKHAFARHLAICCRYRCMRGRRWAGFCPARLSVGIHHRERWAGLADLAPTSGTAVPATVGSTAPGSLTAPRGQLKSSARPLRAATGSPLVRVRVTVASVAGATRPPPSNSSGATRVNVSGTTGPACRPLGRTTRLGVRRLRGGIDWDRQRDRETFVAHDALDFALHIVRKLAGAELGEIDAIAGAQAANLAFVVRTLRRVAARLVDEAVPNVDVDDPRLVGPTAIELVEVG